MDMEQPIFNDIESNLGSSEADTFACCSLYRQCSDAKRCLRSAPYYKNCQYRKQLEAGNIFYGKNVPGFSTIEYKEFTDTISRLSGEVKKEYQQILYFSRYRLHIYWPNSQNVQLLVKAGLVTASSCLEFILTHYSNSSLLSLVKSYPLLLEKWSIDKAILQQESKKNNTKFILKNAIVPWIRSNAPAIVSAIESRYCHISIPSDLSKYATEYIIDCRLFADQPKVLHPLANDESFLKGVF